MHLIEAPDLVDLLSLDPYALAAQEKAAIFDAGLSRLTALHYQRCSAYARILDLLGIDVVKTRTAAEIPFLPVRLFKEVDLLSISPEQVFKVMTSSGTSGQQVSRIYLDKDTAALQSKVLSRLMIDLLGKSRRPMLVIDSPAILRQRNTFSARGAGILGFSLFGRDVTYALDEHMNLDLSAIKAFLERHTGQAVFVFGFTFMVWQHFYLALKQRNLILPLENGILLHGGGWKKLQAQAVDNHTFRSQLMESTGLSRVVNYYGMVEQTGSICMECEEGHLHAPLYSDIFIRDHRDFSILPIGQTGLVEIVSLLPRSYPGHALLTEDLGVCLGEDDCACGRRGKYFSISGRIAQAEARGCSDTYAATV